jgi:hypothetical protein
MAKIVAQTTEPAASVEFDYDVPENLAGMVERFGEEVVYSHVKRSVVIAAQGAARGLMKGGKDGAEIQTAMQTWKPGEPRTVKSAQDKISALIEKLSPEEREALLADLGSPNDEDAPAKKGKKG